MCQAGKDIMKKQTERDRHENERPCSSGSCGLEKQFAEALPIACGGGRVVCSGTKLFCTGEDINCAGPNLSEIIRVTAYLGVNMTCRGYQMICRGESVNCTVGETSCHPSTETKLPLLYR